MSKAEKWWNCNFSGDAVCKTRNARGISFIRESRHGKCKPDHFFMKSTCSYTTPAAHMAVASME